LIAFGSVLFPASIWMWYRLGLFQFFAHFELVLNSFILCYFITDDAYLAKMLLSALAIHLSIGSTIVPDILTQHREFNDLPTWFYFQVIYWRHFREKEFKKYPEESLDTTERGETFRRYYNLVYRPSEGISADEHG
jgi:hypothetical protein